MANIGNLVDRTFREYLEPMDDLVSFTTLSTGVNNSIQSIVFDGDLLSIDLRKAIDSIGEITGQITNDEMLGNIFSNFCIGK